MQINETEFFNVHESIAPTFVILLSHTSEANISLLRNKVREVITSSAVQLNTGIE